MYSKLAEIIHPLSSYLIINWSFTLGGNDMKHLFSFAFIKKVQEQMKHREIKALPEQIAFNLIMAIVPLLVVIVQLGTYLSLNTDIVKYLITAYAPQEVQQLLLYLFNTSSTIQ